MSATTPEGRVKKSVKDILKRYGSKVDGFWPVPSGLGESHLDYVGCVNTPRGGLFFAIETKAPGKKPTPRQLFRINTVKEAGGVVFVIDGTLNTDTVGQLMKWLDLVTSEGN
jgi:hypothetical protein